MVQRQVLHKPSTGCLRRVGIELNSLRQEPLPGIGLWPDENFSTLVHALVEGPEETPYEGGMFHFVLYVKSNYPHEPPLVRLMTTGNGSVRFNPQFYTSGKVCLSILNTWPGPGWNPAFSLRVVLLQLQALMNKHPALNEPGVMIMNNPEDYNAFLRHETLRVAVLQLFDEAEERLAEAEAAAAAEESGAAALSKAPGSTHLDMPLEMAKEVVAKVKKEAANLEARCRSCTASTPDGFPLAGVPRGVRAEYAALAQRFRALHAAEATAEVAGEEEEAPECRICGGGAEDGELLQPCGCSGSIANVHRACAVEWIRRNHSPQCPICGQSYSDPQLRAAGTLRRYKKRCIEFGQFSFGAGILFACLLLNLTAGARLLPIEIAPWELNRWHVRPAPRRPEAEERQKALRQMMNQWVLDHPASSADPEETVFWEPDDANVQDYQLTPPYRLRGRWLLPALELRERWQQPLVEEFVFHPLTPWSTRTLPVPVRYEAMVRYLQQRRFFQMRPVALKQVLNHWQSQTALEQVRRQPTRKSTRNMSTLEVKAMGRGRGHIGLAASLRCRLRQAVEPAPAVTVRLRPPYATEVAVLLVLFAWLALGVRPFFWMMICCHLCSRWFPFPLVAAAAVLANFLRYQVKRRLARLQMMRTRSQLEADGLLLLLLLLGAACAGTGQGGLSLFELRPGGLGNLPPPPQELDASPPLGFIFWLMLVLVSLVAMGTVAKCPEDLEGADYWAPLRHGCAWAFTGALLCFVAAAPIFA